MTFFASCTFLFIWEAKEPSTELRRFAAGRLRFFLSYSLLLIVKLIYVEISHTLKVGVGYQIFFLCCLAALKADLETLLLRVFKEFLVLGTVLFAKRCDFNDRLKWDDLFWFILIF